MNRINMNHWLKFPDCVLQADRVDVRARHAPNTLHHVCELPHQYSLRTYGIIVVDLIVEFVVEEIINQWACIQKALDPAIHEACVPEIVQSLKSLA